MLKKLNLFITNILIRGNSAKYGMREVLASQRGAGAVEYALVLAVVVTMVVGAAFVMREPLEAFFGDVVEAVRSMW